MEANSLEAALQKLVNLENLVCLLMVVAAVSAAIYSIIRPPGYSTEKRDQRRG